MTNTVTILRCAWCKKSFTYQPEEDDKCPPGAPNQVCDECWKLIDREFQEEEKRFQSWLK